MKIIDLLNKIANGEEVPKKIKYNEYTFELVDDEYIPITNDYYGQSLFDYIDFIDLKNEVEVIEEDKKIKKIKTLNVDDTFSPTDVQVVYDIRTLKNKINEIADKISDLEELKENKNV